MKALLRQAAAIEHATGVFGTSHAACALGLFDGSATLGARGVPIGPLTSGPGGLFCYDPWEIYGQPRKFGVYGTNVTIAGEIGAGKALDVDTPIPVPTGWRRMGDLRAGDQVFDDQGRPTEVIAATEVMHGHDCFEVCLSDGTTIIADADHIWVSEVRMSRGRKPRRATSLTTREMAETLRDESGQKRHAIRLTEPLELPERDLPVPPRLLGLWLGDGDTNGRGFTTPDAELAEEFRAAGYPVRKGRGPYYYELTTPPIARHAVACLGCGETIEPGVVRTVFCTRSCAKRAFWGGMRLARRTCEECGIAIYEGSWHDRCRPCRTKRSWRGVLQAAGVLNDKHVPPVYLRASTSQRRDLLSGLLDSDGGVSYAGGVEYYSSNECLARDVYELVCSLGYRPTLRSKQARLNGKDCRIAWQVTFTTHDEVFRLARQSKLQRERRPDVDSTRTSLRYVTDVRAVASRPVRCIRVANADGMFLAGRAMMPTHNSTGTQVYLRRQHPCGRYIRVIDPRGEYRRLCADLGGEAIALSRGGGITLNPLESPDTKHELLRSVASAAARRALNEYEPALLNTALDAAGEEPTLPVVLDRLFHPTVEMAERVATTPRRFAHEARSIAMALQPLCEGDLRGLFDGPTTEGIDFTNPFVCLDLSELYDDQSLGILMACAIAFLQAQIDAHYRQGELRDEIPKSILVVDEAWRILALPGVGAWLRKAFKFSRKQAQQNIAIMHGFRDLDAAGDDGSTVTKVARGLARDCKTFVLYKMSEADADEAQALLGLTNVERDILVWGLERADALWCVGGHRFVVTTYATASDLQVTSPDEAMRV